MVVRAERENGAGAWHEIGERISYIVAAYPHAFAVPATLPDVMRMCTLATCPAAPHHLLSLHFSTNPAAPGVRRHCRRRGGGSFLPAGLGEGAAPGGGGGGVRRHRVRWAARGRSASIVQHCRRALCGPRLHQCWHPCPADYQRTRVERVCARLGLVSLAYLWHQPQVRLPGAQQAALSLHHTQLTATCGGRCGKGGLCPAGSVAWASQRCMALR